jgi:hypothetical protein
VMRSWRLVMGGCPLAALRAGGAVVWLLIMARGIIIENVIQPPSLCALPGETVAAVQRVRQNG